MEELRKLLNNIDDSYFEFVSAMEHYAQKNAARLEMLTAYIKRNPGSCQMSLLSLSHGHRSKAFPCQESSPNAHPKHE